LAAVGLWGLERGYCEIFERLWGLKKSIYQFLIDWKTYWWEKLEIKLVGLRVLLDIWFGECLMADPECSPL